MTSLADLAAQQSRLHSQIQGLGSPPPGDPAALRAYAQFLQREADKAGDLAHHEATLVGQIDFVSHGASRLFTNMRDVSQSFAAAKDMLDHAARAVTQRAGQIEGAQQDWARRRAALDGQLAALDRQVARRSA